MINSFVDILFPSKCEVVEFPDTYVYPIFKNGRSSILKYSRLNQSKILVNTQLKKCKVIDIVLRNPQDRFISGINTFLWTTKLDHPELDTKTILYFAENYLFLNRHYMPQISWLMNLNRYISAETKLRLHSMDYISELTGFHAKPDGEKMLLKDSDIDRLKNNPANEIFLKLDNLLLSLIDKTLTFEEILGFIQTQDPIAYSKLKCIVLD